MEGINQGLRKFTISSYIGPLNVSDLNSIPNTIGGLIDKFQDAVSFSKIEKSDFISNKV